MMASLELSGSGLAQYTMYPGSAPHGAGKHLRPAEIVLMYVLQVAGGVEDGYGDYGGECWTCF